MPEQDQEEEEAKPAPKQAAAPRQGEALGGNKHLRSEDTRHQERDEQRCARARAPGLPRCC